MTDHSETLQIAQRHIMAGQFQTALDALAPVIKTDADTHNNPSAQEAHYMAAVAQRYLGQTEAANNTLIRLKELSPEFGRAWQETGHLLRVQGHMIPALKAFENAVRFNPALEASWQMIAQLEADRGHVKAAQHAHSQAVRLKQLPRALVGAMNHLAEGRLMKAENLCRNFLQKHPHHSEAMRLLADIGVRMSVLDDAEFLLESAAEFEPDNLQIRLDYIQVLRKRQKYEAALEQSNSLLKRDTENPIFISHAAIDHMHTGQFDRAIELFDQVLSKIPNDPATLTSKGHALKTWGKQTEAIDSYQKAIKAKPDHGDAWYGLANLKTYRFGDDERTQMQKALASSALMAADRIHISFALAKAFEDEKNYALAFEHYQNGNSLKKRASRYDANQMQAELKTQAQVANTEFLAKAQQGGGCPAPDPIFIVGLPRAGSTLLEQILASHSQIDGTLELPHILSTAHKLRGRIGNNRYPDALKGLSDEQAYALGQAYIDNTRIHRADAPFFTDKMPNNFRHIGLIKRILPNAKIIDARRDPMACCFSAFKQLFAEGQEFSYDLADVGQYYRDYVELMDHFDQAAPGMVLRVQYEDVIADTETQVRRILDYLELEFEEACINFHQTQRAVRTASSEQVREKINTKGLSAWQPFEPWLAPLKGALGPIPIK